MIDTRIEGDPVAVTGLAVWLRDSLRAKVDHAGDQAHTARVASSRSWHGEAGEAYRAVAHDLIRASDDHTRRIGRTAALIEEYAAHLTRIQQQMEALRAEATAGGLTLTGTTIHRPPPAASPAMPHRMLTPAEHHLYQERLATYHDALDRVRLYDRLREEADAIRTRHRDWIDAHLKPAPAELETDAADTSRLLDLLYSDPSTMLTTFTIAAGQNGLRRTAERMRQTIADRRAKARSGHPGTRAHARRLAQHETDWRKRALAAGRGAKTLGPASWAIDLTAAAYDLHQGEDPGKVLGESSSGIAGGAAGGAAGAWAAVAGTAGVAALTGISAPAWVVPVSAGLGAVAGVKAGQLIWSAIN